MRAQEHLELLEREINECVAAIANENGHTISRHFDPDGSQEILTLQLIAPAPSLLRWSTMTGEIVSLYRSSLDNAIYALSVNANPAERHDRVAFPVFRHKHEFEARKKNGAMAVTSGDYKVRQIPDPAKAIVQRVQPFDRTDEAVRTHILWLLDQLWDIDKHRLPIVAALGANLISVGTTLADRTPFMWSASSRLDVVDGAEVGRIRFEPGTHPQVDVDFQATIEVVLRDPPGFEGPLMRNLIECAKFTYSLIRELSAHFV